MKVLLAEDEKDLQEVVAEFLRMNEYTVITADNGREAVEKAAQDAFDILVLDIMMPEMDGLQAIREIRKNGDSTPALFLTAKAEVDDRVEGLDAGADDYLTKPFAMKELLARLRALGRRAREYRIPTRSLGNVVLDTEHTELRAQNTIAISAREVKLMDILMGAPEKSFTTEQLWEEVWREETASKEVVWMYISFLRSKLESIGADISIEGEQGGNYRIHV